MHTDTNLNKLDYTTIVQQARAASTLVVLCPAFLASPSEWAWFGHKPASTLVLLCPACLQVQVSGHGLVDSGS